MKARLLINRKFSLLDSFFNSKHTLDPKVSFVELVQHPPKFNQIFINQGFLKLQ